MRKLRYFLLKNHIAPKWSVFIFDTIVGTFSLLIAIALVKDHLIIPEFTQRALSILVVVVLTNTLFFYIFKTYEGIIRFSGLAEIIRVSGALIGSFFSLEILGVFIGFTSNSSPIPHAILINNLAVSTFFLVGYRFVVKNIYKHSMLTENAVNVILYGGGENGSKLKQTLEQFSNHKYRVIAFLDDGINFIGKSIDNVRIFSFAQVKDVIPSWNVGLLIFANEGIDTMLKNEIVDFCHENEIEVRNLPAIEDWIKGTGSISQLEKINIEDLLGRQQITLQNDKVAELLFDKVVLVTGAAGSIGSELSRQIAMTNPAMLILCDQNESGLYDLEYQIKTEIPACENVVVYIGDIRDENSMENMFERFRPNLVYHAAAYKHVPMMEAHASEAVRNNVLGTKILADLSVEYGIERFLLISTDKAINPTNVMGATKRVSEIYVQALGDREKKVIHINHANGSENSKGNDLSTKFITTRFGNVLGSNGSVIPRFKEQISKGGPVTVTHPEIIRFFMTIPESCSLVLEASAMGKGGEVFLFDMGSAIKIVDLARKMIRLAGFAPDKEIKIQFSGLRPGEKLYEELLNDQEEVIPTHHKKILIARVAEYDFYKVNKSIDTLIGLSLQNQDLEVVKQMKRIIPEYISNNSVYSVIDNEKSESELLLLKKSS